jgi:DNA-binding MarR family transcriptional regulator
VDQRLVDLLEDLVVGSVGLTAVALARLGEPRDLTVTQWRALVVVAGSDGIRIGEIATRMRLSIPSTSRLIRRLEDRGLVSTARDELDRRGTIVRPTSTGRELWLAVVRERRRLITEALDALPEPASRTLQRELRALKGVFERFA